MKYEERYIRENFGVYSTYFSENKYYINRWNFEEDAIAKIYLNIKIHPEYFWRSIRVNIDISFETNNNQFIDYNKSYQFEFREKVWNKMCNYLNRTLSIQKELLYHLVMSTVFNAAQRINLKLYNTSFDKFILPTLNIYELIEERSMFKIEKYFVYFITLQVENISQNLNFEMSRLAD